MRSLVELIGMIGIGVSALIVIIVVGLILLAVILIGNRRI
jgi:Sec-independent protein translocase protein TatA